MSREAYSESVHKELFSDKEKMISMSQLMLNKKACPFCAAQVLNPLLNLHKVFAKSLNCINVTIMCLAWYSRVIHNMSPVCFFRLRTSIALVAQHARVQPARTVPGSSPQNENMTTAARCRFQSRSKHIVNETGSSNFYTKWVTGYD